MCDLFIHYVEHDRDWVEKNLLNWLQKSGVGCCSEANFRPGVPRLQELENFIWNSRRTLLVLSRDYLHDNFGQMADLLAASYGLKKDNWAVIPLRLDNEKLPPHLDQLVPIDATDSAHWPELSERLLKTVQSPVPTRQGTGAGVGAAWPTEVITSLSQGLGSLRTDYRTGVNNFLVEYLGTARYTVPFGGREADLARLDLWLDDPASPPYLLLSAPAGRGKSALLARWNRRLLTRGDLAVAFFPVSIRYNTNLASVVFATLTARLASLHNVPLPEGTEPPVGIWRGLFGDYISRPLPGGRRLLLIVDGVDEAAGWEPGHDLFPFDPPPGLRVVLSARSRGGDGDAWLEMLGWKGRPDLARSLGLERLTVEGVADVLSNMGSPLDLLAERVDIVGQLHRLSEGDPLLVRLYVDDLRKSGEAAARLQPKDLDKIPPGLDGYFRRWWDDQQRLWGEREPLLRPAVQALLNLLACALGPLSREDVLQLAPPKVELSTWTLGEALRPLNRLVIGDGKDQGFAFSHPRLRDYFYEEMAPTERQAMEGRFLSWGETTLKELNEGKRTPEQASPYLMQYYGTHLEQYYSAHLERSKSGVEAFLALVSDGWRRAWEALDVGAYAGFLNDVDRAWRAAEGADRASLQAGALAPYIGAEARCALCRASINSLARNVPSALLKALVEHGTWTPARGLVYARLTTVASQGAESLTVLAPYLPADLLNQVLAAAQDIGDETNRAKALIGLVPHLPEPLKGQACQQALAAAQAIGDETNRVRELSRLAPHLPEPLKGQVCQQALDAAQAIGNEDNRAEALICLAPHLQVDLLSQALAAAHNIGLFRENRARVLTGLAPHLPEPLKGQACQQALDAALDIDNKKNRASALTGLAPHLPEPLKGQACQQALDAAQTIGDEWSRAWALISLVPHLPEPLKGQACQQALDAVQAIGDELHRAWALTGLAPHLPADLMPKALDAAQAIRSEWSRARALIALVPYLAEPLKGQACQQALDAVQAIEYEFHRADALTGLAPHLAEPLKGQACQQALDAAQAIGNEQNRAEALAGLAPQLPMDLLPKALAAAQAIGDEGHRAEALTGLAPHLPVDLQRKALAAAQAIGNEIYRARALTDLVPHLSEPSKGRACQQALDAAQAIGNEIYRARALTDLVPHLPADLLPKALAAAQAFGAQERRVKALTDLAPHLARLPSSDLYDPWRKALHILADRTRQNLLSDLQALVPVIRALGGPSALADVFHAIQEVGRWWP